MPRFRFRIGDKTVVLPDGRHDVGRLPACWLVLDDELVSRAHARIHVGPVNTAIEDLGSRNGTFVNDDRLDTRRELNDGDRIRIGRAVIEVLPSEPCEFDEDDGLRSTLDPGEDTRFPGLISQLVEKSLKSGKVKDAERYALVLASQLGAAKIPAAHPAVLSCTRALLQLATKTSSGTWIDRLFKLYAFQGWLMESATLDDVRGALDRIPRVVGGGLREYEQTLRLLAREGVDVPLELTRSVGELADAYSG